jgi:hypothetical protein
MIKEQWDIGQYQKGIIYTIQQNKSQILVLLPQYQIAVTVSNACFQFLYFSFYGLITRNS